MATLFLLLLAIAGGVVVADLVLENTTATQITLFHHTVSGWDGWLLAVAAGLGALVALLLVASLNATKGRRVRRGQLRRLRRGVEHQVVAPEPDHARLLDEFFGPEETPRNLAGPGRLAGPRDAGRGGLADDYQSAVIPIREPIEHHPEPLYEQARRAAGLHNGWEPVFPASQGRRR